MMRAPGLAEIDAAESRVAQSTHDARDRLCQARSAARAILAKPSTLLLAVGTAGVAGFWIARRRKPQPASPADGAVITPRASIAALVLGFVVQQAMQRLPLLLHHFWAAQRERAEARAAQPRHAAGAD